MQAETTATETQADRVIGKFGSMARLQRALGHEHPTTVQRWKESGIIPMRQVPKVLRAAKSVGVDLAWEDFEPVVGRRGHE